MLFFLTLLHSNYVRVLSKEIPLIARMDQADHIVSMVRLKQQFDFDLVIIGGAEAHVIAPFLAQNDVPVILSPPRCAPSGLSC